MQPSSLFRSYYDKLIFTSKFPLRQGYFVLFNVCNIHKNILTPTHIFWQTTQWMLINFILLFFLPPIWQLQLWSMGLFAGKRVWGGGGYRFLLSPFCVSRKAGFVWGCGLHRNRVFFSWWQGNLERVLAGLWQKIIRFPFEDKQFLN